MRSQCKECGGKGLCEHGRQRSRCKECGGKGICEHGRRRDSCKECRAAAAGSSDGNASKKRKQPQPNAARKAESSQKRARAETSAARLPREAEPAAEDPMFVQPVFVVAEFASDEESEADAQLEWVDSAEWTAWKTRAHIPWQTLRAAARASTTGPLLRRRCRAMSELRAAARPRQVEGVGRLARPVRGIPRGSRPCCAAGG